MATVAPQDRKENGVQTLSFTTLDGSTDQFPYNRVADQTLIIKNSTAGALSPVLVGDATTFDPAGYEPPIDVSTGYAIGSLAVDDEVILHLPSVREILGNSGNVAINSGVGLEVALLEG